MDTCKFYFTVNELLIFRKEDLGFVQVESRELKQLRRERHSKSEFARFKLYYYFSISYKIVKCWGIFL